MRFDTKQVEFKDLLIVVSWSRVVCFALAAFALSNGAVRAQVITEFKEGLSGCPGNITSSNITTGPDGNLWFTEDVGNRIGRITPLGVITEFSAGITERATPEGITVGPDGNLWFTEYVSSRIGRITPQGVITEFGDGITPFSYPTGITAGPDGNLWFTENNANRIGRITPLGEVTEFSTGISPYACLYSIIAGPDGNLWFTECGDSRIGRITPLGAVTEFTSGITTSGSPNGSEPLGITVGPDGNLWFTEYYGYRIGRITPAGVVTEFSDGIAVVFSGFQPFPGYSGRLGLVGITAGPDGNLWFTESFDRIGRITPTGVVTEFSAGITPLSYPTGITAGPDGNLWFTEECGIGRVNLRAAASAPPTIRKSFGAATIALNGSTSLSFTISNPNASTALTGVGFTDTLPSGLVVSTPNGVTGGCDGGAIVAVAGWGRVSLAGATLAESSSCTLSVNVTGKRLGTYENITGVTSVEGGTRGTTSATLTVLAVRFTSPTSGPTFHPQPRSGGH
jgi:streptogramin lyase